MDESLMYINMADNEDIQGLRTYLERGDYWCWASNKEKVYLCRDRTPRIDKRGSNRKIWLPTQAQFQKMDFNTLEIRPDELAKFYEACVQKLPYPPRSWDQLWLAYAKQKMFHKVWDGSCWIAGEV